MRDVRRGMSMSPLVRRACGAGNQLRHKRAINHQSLVVSRVVGSIAGPLREVVRMHRLAAVALLASLLPAAAAAQGCPDRPDALGTARTLAVDAGTTPRVGKKQFPATLPLADKELVLTFDDGPWPGTTPAVLAALKAECVKATFFLLGRNAQAHPGLVRREAAEGHTIGHHSFSHPLLRHMDTDKAMAEVDKGVRADNAALAGRPSAPFFRFPGFASAPVLLG